MMADNAKAPFRWGCVVWPIVVLGILILVDELFFFPSGPPREYYRQSACKNNLLQIGEALFAYQQTNSDYIPYHERGPRWALSLLYPEYMDDPEVFVCPSVKKKHLPKFPEGCSLAGLPCAYAYDHETNPRYTQSGHVIGADLQRNHLGGQNVVYYDGHTSWNSDNFCSNDPNDNIWLPEPGWDPDTDSYLRQ